MLRDINRRYAVKEKIAMVTITVNFGADTSTYHISLVAIDYVLITFDVFGRMAEEQEVQPRGVITRVFFFTMTTDASFKRFMPGIARVYRDNVYAV